MDATDEDEVWAGVPVARARAAAASEIQRARAVEPFAFGLNWARYSRHIDAARIAAAEEALGRLLGRDDLTGLSFLDVGCGSGIHTLAALRMGACPVVALDRDEAAVATTRDTLQRHWSRGGYALRQANLFTLSRARTGSFDVVYSWGVLHHSGDLRGGLRAVSRLVGPGGLLAIGLYKRTPLCGLWKREKAWFTSAGPGARRAAVTTFVAAKVMRDLVRLRNPVRRLRSHRVQRGMHWYTDAVDWLGGHPYESATPEEVRTLVEPLGFELESSFHAKRSLGIFGSGNAEYRFRSTAAAPARGD